MTSTLRPGNKGTSLPDDVIVLRLAKLSMDASESHRAHEASFSLSTDDENSELKSLTVWAKDLTSAEKARELMGANRAAYFLALYLNTDQIRAIQIFIDFSDPLLDVVWDPDPRPGAEGHAGIIGLMRPPQGERKMYKALRTKLAELAIVESLPTITV